MTVVVGAGGALLGFVTGAWLHPVLGVVMAVVGGLNGVVSGRRRIYRWDSLRGWVAFVLDSTWATLPVAVGLLAHLAGKGYVAEMSEGRGHHVYRAGFTLKPGFALTVGNVIAGAGDVERARRARLIHDHEAVHVWQARWFGPLYLPLYGLWSGLGAVTGLLVWLVRLLRGRRQPVSAVVESCSYYLNPFEWWAYSRDDHWPPQALVVGWKRPAVESFQSRRS
ncbi:MAG: hypothetical protein ACKPDI_02620 [Actinomycetota bacterium]